VPLRRTLGKEADVIHGLILFGAGVLAHVAYQKVLWKFARQTLFQRNLQKNLLDKLGYEQLIKLGGCVERELAKRRGAA